MPASGQEMVRQAHLVGFVIAGSGSPFAWGYTGTSAKTTSANKAVICEAIISKFVFVAHLADSKKQRGACSEHFIKFLIPTRECISVGGDPIGGENALCGDCVWIRSNLIPAIDICQNKNSPPGEIESGGLASIFDHDRDGGRRVWSVYHVTVVNMDVCTQLIHNGGISRFSAFQIAS